jgi:hypothetical protein
VDGGVLGDNLIEAVGVGGAAFGDDGVDDVGLIVGAEVADVGEDCGIEDEGDADPF